MSALVYFTDKILYTCSIKEVFVQGKISSAKYNDGKKYAARVLAISDDDAVLKTILRNFEHAGESTEDEWVFVDKQDVTFNKACKALGKNKDHNVAFVDKSILAEQLERDWFHWLSLNHADTEEDFFEKPSHFVKLKINRRSEKETAAMNEFLPKTKTAEQDSLGHEKPASHDLKIQTDEEKRKDKGTSPSIPQEEEEFRPIPKDENKSTYDLAKGRNDEGTSPSTTQNDSFCDDQKKLSTRAEVNLDQNCSLDMRTIEEMPFSNLEISQISEMLKDLEQNGENNEMDAKKVLISPRDENFSMEVEVESNVPSQNEVLPMNFHTESPIEKFPLNESCAQWDIDPFENNIVLPIMQSTLNEADIAQSEKEEIANDEISKSETIVEETVVDSQKINNSKTDINYSKRRIMNSEIYKPNHVGFIKKTHVPTNKQYDKLTDENSNFTSEPHFSKNKAPVRTSPNIDENHNEATNCKENDEDLCSDTSGDENYEPENVDSESSCSNEDERTYEKNRKAEGSKPLNITIGDNCKTSAPHDINLIVENSAATGIKKHFCLYCRKMQTKIARHLELIHSDESDVKKFILLPPKNKERKEIIATIRKAGDHLFNTDKTCNNGELIVCRRPNERMAKNATDFLSCANCKGQYARSVIRHHWRKCTNLKGKKERIVVVKGRKIAARVHERANDFVRKQVFPYMREDEVVRTTRYDELVILFANKQCVKFCTHQHLFQLVRAKVRLLGRFLLAIKQIDNRIKNFSDVFQPRHYDAAVEAVRAVAQFIPRKNLFKHPAVASGLGTLLKSCGEILSSECIKKELPDQKLKVDNFISLLKEDYGASINRVVTETQTQNNRREEILLPSDEDIAKFHSYLENKMAMHYGALNEKFSSKTWHHLAETVLLLLEVFNRRRPGEIERLYIEDFKSHRGIDNIENKEIYRTLTEKGKELARRYVRFEIRGKLGRGVPVLVDKNVFDSIELILKHRDDVGVPKDNPYLFGIPSDDDDRFKWLGACTLMRQYSGRCQADNPERLRATELRKHAATKSLNFNLTDGQKKSLHNFMGHSTKIHEQFYQQPALEDITKMSLLLLNMAQGADGELDFGNVEEDEPIQVSFDQSTSNRSNENNSVVNSTPRRWLETERKAVLSAFKEHLRENKIPSGKEIQTVIYSNDCLRGRTVPQIRTWLHTQKKKKN